MGRSDVPPIRSLPRIFVEGASADGPIELPSSEVDKLRKVLRLSAGAQIAVLPNDGSLFRCEFDGRRALPIEVVRLDVEPAVYVRVCQALPKPDRLESLIRACTEIGVSEFVLFPSERSVVRWDARKTEDRLQRLRAIARESAELSYRSRLPTLGFEAGLSPILGQFPDAVVLSESETVSRFLTPYSHEMTLVIGPEGGWAPRELAAIGDRGATLGPRVLRVDHAAAAAAALLLLRPEAMAAPAPSQ